MAFASSTDLDPFCLGAVCVCRCRLQENVDSQTDIRKSDVCSVKCEV